MTRCLLPLLIRHGEALLLTEFSCGCSLDSRIRLFLLPAEKYYVLGMFALELSSALLQDVGIFLAMKM